MSETSWKKFPTPSRTFSAGTYFQCVKDICEVKILRSVVILFSSREREEKTCAQRKIRRRKLAFFPNFTHRADGRRKASPVQNDANFACSHEPKVLVKLFQKLVGVRGKAPRASSTNQNLKSRLAGICGIFCRLTPKSYLSFKSVDKRQERLYNEIIPLPPRRVCHV